MVSVYSVVDHSPLQRSGLHDVDIAQIESWVRTVFEHVNNIEPKKKTMEETPSIQQFTNRIARRTT